MDVATGGSEFQQNLGVRYESRTDKRASRNAQQSNQAQVLDTRKQLRSRLLLWSSDGSAAARFPCANYVHFGSETVTASFFQFAERSEDYHCHLESQEGPRSNTLFHNQNTCAVAYRPTMTPDRLKNLCRKPFDSHSELRG